MDVDVEEGCGVDCDSGCLVFGFGFRLGARTGGRMGRMVDSSARSTNQHN